VTYRVDTTPAIPVSTVEVIDHDCKTNYKGVEIALYSRTSDLMLLITRNSLGSW
jgi:hypothetical protein